MAAPRVTNNKETVPAATMAKKQELKLFIFIVVVLFPLASVAIIGTYGLVIWLLQILASH
jgi:nitrate reductase NapE